jgi:hypothetical protein
MPKRQAIALPVCLVGLRFLLKRRYKIMVEKSFKQVCACTHCGNEAEMVVTCSLEEHQHPTTPARIITGKDQSEGHTKGHAVCSHCGGEADIWLDF